MCNITSPERTPWCTGLLTCALLLAIVAAATRPALADTGSIVTDYNRDADILLWGLGYRF